MKISLAHDSFTQIGGAERLLDAVHELFPESPVYTTVLDKHLTEHYSSWNIRTSWLQPVYNVFPKLQLLFPLVPVALRSMKVENSSVLFSMSSSYIKGIRKPAGSVHINYCHTPTRFVWTDYGYAESQLPVLLRPFARIYLHWLKRWDYKVAQKVDVFIANSKEVQQRIKKYYGRDSVVVYPFADTNFWKPTLAKSDYFLLAGRLQPHKNNEVVVKLFTKLGLPLHVVGTGRQEQYLRSIAGPNIKFLGRVTDEQLRDEYSGALAFIYPPYEDFGMMSIEAAACGTATIGLGKAGILETVIPGKTGELFAEPTQEHMEPIVKSWDSSLYSQQILVEHAKQFSKDKFTSRILEIIESHHENSN